MAALSSCFCPKICTRNINRTVVPSSMKALLGVSDISFSRVPTSKKLQCDHFIAKSHLAPGALQVSTELEHAAADFSTQTSKTIHVKFQLQKECMFGDEILLVGDHPILGLWNPANAIPMNWSDGHIWNVELDVPIETTMQFKFILKQSTGETCWQPGPDRIFKSWESKAILIIAEDWENPEAQKIAEEQETEPINSGNVTNQMEGTKPNVDSNVTFSADTAYAKEKLKLNTEFLTGGISTYPMEGYLINSNKEIKSKESVSVRKEETTEKDNYTAVTTKNEERMFGYQGQVLAPGLMPQQTEDVRSEELGSTIVDSSFGVDATME